MFSKNNTSDQKVNINTLLVWQIDRCNQALSMGNKEPFIASVDALSITASHLFDEKYKTEIVESTEIYDNQMKEYKQKNGENFSNVPHIKESQMYALANISNDLARRKFSAVMKLLHRKGLLPTSATDDTDVEQSENDYDDTESD